MVVTMASDAPITLTFNISGQQKCIEVRSSSYKDPNRVCPEAVHSNTAVGFSGRHDHGELVKLKSTGPLLELVSSIKDAKQACDAFLTAAIACEAADGAGSPVKKLRVEKAAADAADAGGDEGEGIEGGDEDAGAMVDDES